MIMVSCFGAIIRNICIHGHVFSVNNLHKTNKLVSRKLIP